MRLDNKEKDKINVLLNIDNFFGSHSGRIGPIVIFLLVSATPFLFYVFFLTRILPFPAILIFTLLWTGRMFLLIMCDEKNKLKNYLAAKNDEYVAIKKKFRITHIHDNGLIEFMNGRVGFVIQGTLRSYYNDAVFASHMERFLKQIEPYDYDIHLHLISDEVSLQDELDKLNVYKDKEAIKQRKMFYIRQDQYVQTHSKLYSYSFIVKASRYDWKNLRDNVQRVVKSDESEVFEFISVCNHDDVLNTISRDLGAYIDMDEMLKGKFTVNDYEGSEVLFYGDDIPAEYIITSEETGFDKQRVKEND